VTTAPCMVKNCVALAAPDSTCCPVHRDVRQCASGTNPLHCAKCHELIRVGGFYVNPPEGPTHLVCPVPA
jgi:hypothetical protein